MVATPMDAVYKRAALFRGQLGDLEKKNHLS